MGNVRQAEDREEMAEALAGKPETEEDEEEATTLEATPSGRVTQVPATAALDLERWQRKATNALHAGKPANVPFTSSYIPMSWYQNITERLDKAMSEDDIKAAFDVANVYDTQPDSGLLALAAELKRANDLLEANVTRD